jgi:hypothetical protein
MGISLKNCNYLKGFFPPFLKTKVIKLATSRPRHFLGYHLYQHFGKNATAHPLHSAFNARILTRRPLTLHLPILMPTLHN